jgi:hypothetical protein
MPEKGYLKSGVENLLILSCEFTFEKGVSPEEFLKV